MPPTLHLSAPSISTPYSQTPVAPGGYSAFVDKDTWLLVVDTNVVMSEEEMEAMDAIRTWGMTSGGGMNGQMRGEKGGGMPLGESVTVVVPYIGEGASRVKDTMHDEKWV